MVKASGYAQKWIMSEILPMVGVASTTFFVARNLSINPDVRLRKDDRQAGVLENYEEGRLYRDHEFRKYLSHQHKTVMPAFNEFLTSALPKTPVDRVDTQDDCIEIPQPPPPCTPPCTCDGN